MIDPQTVAKIKGLLVAGELSQRAIARLVGVSRGTVGRIYWGKRRDYPPKDNFSLGDMDESKPAERCATCGGMVYLPCRLCRARNAMEKGRRRFAQPEDPDEAESSHQWRGDERERYEAIRREKEATGELGGGKAIGALGQSAGWQEPREEGDEDLDELEAA